MNMWHDIKGYEGFYQIHENHSVRSLDRIVNHWRGGTRVMKGRILAPVLELHKYYIFCFIKDGERKNVKLHRLIAETFIPNPEKLPFVRHLNDCRWDNRRVNLAWGTQEDNVADAVKNGKMARRPGVTNPMYNRKGALNGASKLVLDLQSGVFFDSLVEAANAKGIERRQLSSMLCGRRKNRTALIYV